MYGEFRGSVINPPVIKILTAIVEHKTEPCHFRRSETCIRNASLHPREKVNEAAMALGGYAARNTVSSSKDHRTGETVIRLKSQQEGRTEQQR